MNLKLIGLLISLILILISVSSMIVAPENNEVTPESDRINLAIRQMAHELLSVNGDSTSRIMPIERSDNAYSLVINQEINYDTLPYLLDNAMQSLEIDEKYYVKILDCAIDSLVLGYHANAFKKGIIACKGRDQSTECYKIEVVIEKQELLGYVSTYLPLLMGIAGLGFVFFYSDKKKESEEETKSSIKIGNSEFIPTNQKLILPGKTKDLTFRESKFLELLIIHKNQVVEREKILNDVWGDEGVIVGRSVDVFISRLRKIIKDDNRLQIKTIHGVGYRLEEV